MSTSVLLGVWVSVGLTLFIYSFLYKDNFFFKLAEHIYIGISVGYSICLMIFKFMKPKWAIPLFIEHQFILIIPTILGIFILTHFIPKISWLARLTFAFIFGFGAGISIPRTITGYIFEQIGGTINPLVSKSGYSFDNFCNLLIFIGVLSTLVYFFFSIEHKKGIGVISKIGIIFLMISFGASFGYTTMARMSLLFGRCYDLFLFSSRKYFYATPILVCLIILSFILLNFRKKQ